MGSTVAAWVLLGGVVVLLDPSWIAHLTCAIPDAAAVGRNGWGADARLIIYVLTWVSDILPHHPAQLFDPPIGYPAPSALTGSEHFLGSQLVFAPVYAASGNPVLAANLATLAAYWLGGIVTFSLLRHWEVSWPAALVGGVVAMLGPLQLPPDLHVLQYPSWCLPLLLLAAARVQRRPSLAQVAALSGAITIAVLSSYQIAVNLALLAALLLLYETLALRGAWRRIAALGIAFLPPLVLLVIVSGSYLRRATEARYHLPVDLSELTAMTGVLVEMWWGEMRWTVLVLAALALLRRHAAPLPQRGAIALGAAAVLVGSLLAFGYSVQVADATVPLPLGLISRFAPTGLLVPMRFVITAAPGLAILAACGVDAVLRLRRVGLTVLLVAVLIPVALHDRARVRERSPLTCLPTAGSLPPAYAWLRAQRSGPLLELPARRLEFSNRNALAQSEAMYLSLFHHFPLINIHTNHVSPVTPMISDVAWRLPDDEALQALVDMTHVRWILAHEDLLLPTVADALHREWNAGHGVALAATFGHDVVYAVGRTPRNDWLEHLSRQREDGRTFLGTPLRPLVEPSGTVTTTAPRAVRAGSGISFHVTVRNDGATAWPAAVPADGHTPYAVAMAADWGGPRPLSARVPLPYDVPPGVVVSFDTRLVAPDAPGTYTTRWRLTQDDAAPFPESAAAVQSITVTP